MNRAPWLELGAIVVAAGSGTRFGDAAKVFASLGGRPVLEHTLRMLASERDVASVVVALAPHTLAAGVELVAALGLRDVTVCAGGATRADSVRAGLRGLDPDIELVAVHDAARPLASRALLQRVVAAAREHGAAAPVLPVPDTLAIVEADGFVRDMLDRAQARAMQTPQVARRAWLEHALAGASTPGDESGALLAAGYRVATVPGERHNLKLTWPDDLRLAEALFGGLSGARLMTIRSGIGYDIHRFAPGRPLRLGGLLFPNEDGLAGHSDADVALHAIADALLGAAALGDIGDHFPPSDERWRDAESGTLLRAVAGLIAGRYLIGNVDVTVVGERPQIAPRRTEMRQRIAELLGVDLEQVSVKATTNEGLGALGRAEGLAALAIVTLRVREAP